MYIWNEQKSLHNQRKHGISFHEAQKFIFEGPNLLATGIAYDKEEARHAVIGKFKGKYFVGIFTIVTQGIRIISVRRARANEEKQAKARGV